MYGIPYVYTSLVVKGMSGILLKTEF
jgi:hypothetical protein